MRMDLGGRNWPGSPKSRIGRIVPSGRKVSIVPKTPSPSLTVSIGIYGSAPRPSVPSITFTFPSCGAAGRTSVAAPSVHGLLQFDTIFRVLKLQSPTSVEAHFHRPLRRDLSPRLHRSLQLSLQRRYASRQILVV